MAYLLDTHAFLWFASADKQLPKQVVEIIQNAEIPCFLSAASLLEITIKHQIGKLTLGISLHELFTFVDRNLIEVIPINYIHLLQFSELPRLHSDPFDRIIIAQALSENLTILTRDKSFNNYQVAIKWS